jgi:Phage integrase, N-terminal SAM-like domain
MNQFPRLIRTSTPGGEARYVLGDPLVDSYLAFVAGRCRPNTLRAVAHDLKTFFSVIDKDPVEVVGADVFDFVADQRGDRTVVRISDGESGLSARTIARRLSSISGFYAYLVVRGDTPVTANPVPRGLSTRRRGGRRRQVPLVRVPPRADVVRRPEGAARAEARGAPGIPVGGGRSALPAQSRHGLKVGCPWARGPGNSATTPRSTPACPRTPVGPRRGASAGSPARHGRASDHAGQISGSPPSRPVSASAGSMTSLCHRRNASSDLQASTMTKPSPDG